MNIPRKRLDGSLSCAEKNLIFGKSKKNRNLCGSHFPLCHISLWQSFLTLNDPNIVLIQCYLVSLSHLSIWGKCHLKKTVIPFDSDFSSVIESASILHRFFVPDISSLAILFHDSSSELILPRKGAIIKYFEFLVLFKNNDNRAIKTEKRNFFLTSCIR